MEKEQKAVFAQRLGKLRNDRKMSQEELSAALGIDRGTIAKYETEKRIPSYEHLTSFAKYFNVSTDYLLGLTENATNDIETRKICDYIGLSEKCVNLFHLLQKVKQKRTELYKDDNGRLFEIDVFSNIIEMINNDPDIIREIIAASEINENIDMPFDYEIEPGRVADIVDNGNGILITGRVYKRFLLNQVSNSLWFILNDMINLLAPDEYLSPDRVKRSYHNPRNMFYLAAEELEFIKEVSNNGKHNPEEE